MAKAPTSNDVFSLKSILKCFVFRYSFGLSASKWEMQGVLGRVHDLWSEERKANLPQVAV